MGFEVEVRNVDGAVTALGAAGPHTLVVDSPAAAVQPQHVAGHAGAERRVDVQQVRPSFHVGQPVPADTEDASLTWPEVPVGNLQEQAGAAAAARSIRALPLAP
jgi:hypothetical protein